jgi:hypothetical protein
MSQPKALRHAQELDRRGLLEEATELRRLHDLLGKANALCRIRAAEIERLKAEKAELLEALRTAADHLEGMPDPEDVAACVAKARAAIARAEGELNERP